MWDVLILGAVALCAIAAYFSYRIGELEAAINALADGEADIYRDEHGRIIITMGEH